MRKLSLVALLSPLASFAGDYHAYFDSVKVSTVGAAQDSIGPMVAIGTIFVVIGIVVGLIMRSRNMGKQR